LRYQVPEDIEEWRWAGYTNHSRWQT
jgi:hypothetical protein